MADAPEFLPGNSERHRRLLDAIKMRVREEYDEAERLLTPSVSPPSIHYRHYRELFNSWRQKITRLEASRDYAGIVRILERMIRLDGEMLQKMSDYWSPLHGTAIPPESFRGYSNLLRKDILNLTRYSALLHSKKTHQPEPLPGLL